MVGSTALVRPAAHFCGLRAALAPRPCDSWRGEGSMLEREIFVCFVCMVGVLGIPNENTYYVVEKIPHFANEACARHSVWIRCQKSAPLLRCRFLRGLPDILGLCATLSK